MTVAGMLRMALLCAGNVLTATFTAVNAGIITDLIPAVRIIQSGSSAGCGNSPEECISATEAEAGSEKAFRFMTLRWREKP